MPAEPLTPPPPTELDYQLLQQLDLEPSASQRSLAARLGISVGKLNFCLRALVDKGWVKAQNFRRSDNKWAYAYLLTPHGVGAKLQLTREFLARKEREFEALGRQIHALRGELARDGQPPAGAEALTAAAALPNAPHPPNLLNTRLSPSSNRPTGPATP